MREFFNLAENPLFIKHFRSRLRRGAVMPAVVMVLLASCLIFFADWKTRENNPNIEQNLGVQIFFWFQMFLLVIVGGSQIASSVAYVRDSNILDYHRMTPIPPAVQTIGFLIGAPIREYLLYLLTIPFAVLCALMGDVGIVDFSKLFIVQVCAVLMSHSLAMITGLAAKSTRTASGTFIGIIAGLNLASGALYPAGVYGPTLLTTFPVYEEVIEKKRMAAIRKQIQQQQQQLQQPGFGPGAKQPQPGFGPGVQQPQGKAGRQPARIRQPRWAREPDPVTFFGAEVPIVLQSMMFQGTFLFFLFLGASRRMKSSRIPLWPKPLVIAFMGVVGFLTLGSTWEVDFDDMIMGSLYFLGFFAIVLLGLSTPLRNEVLKGYQRSEKLFGGRLPLWHDLTSTKLLVPILAVLAVVPAIIMTLSHPGAGPAGFRPWSGIAVAGLAVLSFGVARQAFPLHSGKRWMPYFALYIVFLWGLPLGVGAVSMLADRDIGSYVMVISPVVGILAASGAGLGILDQTIAQLIAIVPTGVSAVAFWAVARSSERKIREDVAQEHAPRRQIETAA